MPHYTKKRRSNPRSTKKYSTYPTIREHGFRIVRHNVPVKGKPRSMKNIHGSVHRTFSHTAKSVKKANQMNVAPSVRASHVRAAKSAYQERRNAEKAVEEMERQEREEKKERKVAHVSAMSHLNEMMSKMHF